jgi:hypothetical protein
MLREGESDSEISRSKKRIDNTVDEWGNIPAPPWLMLVGMKVTAARRVERQRRRWEKTNGVSEAGNPTLSAAYKYACLVGFLWAWISC